jgi:hypothetical protein
MTLYIILQLRYCTCPITKIHDITRPILTRRMFIDAFTLSSQGNLPIWQFQIFGANPHNTDFLVPFSAYGYIIRTQLFIITGRMERAVQWPLCQEQLLPPCMYSYLNYCIACPLNSMVPQLLFSRSTNFFTFLIIHCS